MSPGPQLVQWRWSPFQRQAMRAAAALVVLLWGVAIAVAPAEARTKRASRLSGALLFSVWAVRGGFRRVEADADGVRDVGYWGDERLGWDGIECVQMGTLSHRLRGRSGDLTIKLDTDPTGEQMLRMALALSPQLAVLGHGLGLREEPPPADAGAPVKVDLEDHALRIDGPGDNRLCFGDKAADFAQLVQHARNRLVPAMLAASAG